MLPGAVACTRVLSFARTLSGVGGKLSLRWVRPVLVNALWLCWGRKELAHILEVQSNLFAAENDYIEKTLKAAAKRFEVAVLWLASALMGHTC